MNTANNRVDGPNGGPGLLYGTAWKKADTQRLVALALRLGFRGFDTACQPKHYHEAGVGEGLVAGLASAANHAPHASVQASLTRADLFLQTKFTSPAGQDPRKFPYDPHAKLPEQVIQSHAASLRNLQTDYLDCLLLHSPMPHFAQTLEVWRSMEALVDGGGVRQIGISNCYALSDLAALYEAARVKPAVVQNRFHAETRYDRQIRAFCRAQHLSYQSFWTLSANPQILAHPVVAHLAAGYRRSPAQILFRYLTQSGVVPLTGTRSEVHMREDLAIFEFELTEAECTSMDELF